MSRFGSRMNSGHVPKQQSTPPQRNGGFGGNMTGSYTFYHADGRTTQQHYLPMDPDEVQYYTSLQEQGRLEPVLAYKRQLGFDVSDIEALFPMVYRQKTEQQQQYERVELLESLCDFLEVKPTYVVEQVVDDVQSEEWIEKIDNLPFNAPVGYFVEGEAYDDLRSTYDQVASVVIEAFEERVDVLYVPIWKDAMQGWCSGKETRVVSIPSSNEWVDPYFLSTMLPYDEYAQLIYELRQGNHERAREATKMARHMLRTVPVGSTPRGLNYVVLFSNVPEAEMHNFKQACKEGWYDSKPVLVTYGIMPHVWEVGSSLVVIDLYNGIGLYFSPKCVQKYFKENFKNRAGLNGPSVVHSYIDVDQGRYRDNVRLLNRYAYAHFCGYVLGGYVKQMMMRQLRNTELGKAYEQQLNWYDIFWDDFGANQFEKKIPNPDAGYSTVCCWNGKVVPEEWFSREFG